MSEQAIFGKLFKAKRNWSVMPIQSGNCVPGAEKTVQKALQARLLELPVGEWIKEGARREKRWLSEDGLRLLASNFKDEQKHDEQLDYCYRNLSLCDQETKAEIEKESQEIIQKWFKMGEKYHPILVTWIAEQSVFFPVLTIYRRLGGVQLANVASEISRDEAIHARTNGTMSKMLGQQITPELDDLRQETMEWLTSDLDGTIDGIYGQQKSYLDQSYKLLHEGKYIEFKDTSAAIMVGFFETHRSHIPRYGSV
jgi:hypothetical protein